MSEWWRERREFSVLRSEVEQIQRYFPLFGFSGVVTLVFAVIMVVKLSSLIVLYLLSFFHSANIPEKGIKYVSENTVSTSVQFDLC